MQLYKTSSGEDVLHNIRILFFSLLVLLSGSVFAEEMQEPVQAKLISEQQSVVPGKPFFVGIQLDMQKGWDTYWLNPGDAGFATKISWQLPKGFKAGSLLWPYPERFDNQSLVGFGYTNKTLILAEIIPPKELEIGKDITLEADVNWLACSDSCVPGQAHLVLTLPVTDQDVFSAYQTEFALARGLLPHTVDFWNAKLDVKAKTENVVLRLKPNENSFGEIEHMVFIPEEKGIDYHAPQVFEASSGEFVLNIPKDGKHTLPVKGLLLISEKGSEIKKAIQIDTTQADVSLLLAIGLAFLGGIILNVMPCVLPVIALKIFSFVKLAHENRWQVLKHGLFFSGGVLLSFWVLSGILLLLRTFGESVGWGFQLQEPMFVAVLAGIIFILGLSLFGVFEMGTSLISLGGNRSSKGLTGSFMSGILATLVATPCTGPMLGPAIGFAMTLPVLQALVIFSFVGIGMAFPYLFLSCFPQFVRFLPKPGNWMITFKHLMGFLMMATVLWLLWVFSSQTDMLALFAVLFALMIMALAAWIFGTYATAVRSKKTRRVATLVAVLLVAFSAVGSFKVVNHTKVSLQEESTNFSASDIQDLRKSGQTVFVDFTAKWCLICQANKVILHSSEIQKEFQEHSVTFVEADWTKRDPEITEELKKLGRSGVPVYAIYPRDLSQKPTILPQNLTKAIVKEYLQQLNPLSKNDL